MRERLFREPSLLHAAPFVFVSSSVSRTRIIVRPRCPHKDRFSIVTFAQHRYVCEKKGAGTGHLGSRVCFVETVVWVGVFVLS